MKVNLDTRTFSESVTGLNPKATLLQVSAKTGRAIDEWISWLELQVSIGTQPWSG
jgi:Ni2+-binding GTPase involved in maturation of urease and hydrogenase